jgi:hypothetical protein
MELKPLHFFDEPIIPAFDIPPSMEKKQGCPNAFTWRDTYFRVIELVKEWHDYSRIGRIASNRGSWGVGRDFYIVKVVGEHYFQIYYDRAPKDVDHRKGEWFLWGELVLQ